MATRTPAERAAELWADGKSKRDISKILHVRHATVTEYLDKWLVGHPGERLPGRKDGRRARVMELRAQGKSLRAIASRLGVTHETVRNDLIACGRDMAATVQDDGSIPAAAFLALGHCSPQCLLADDRTPCECCCGGAFHGELADTPIVMTQVRPGEVRDGEAVRAAQRS